MGRGRNLLEYLAVDVRAEGDVATTVVTNAVAPETYDDDPGALWLAVDQPVTAPSSAGKSTVITRVSGETYDDDPGWSVTDGDPPGQSMQLLVWRQTDAV
jgi:hypothetical protein